MNIENFVQKCKKTQAYYIENEGNHPQNNFSKAYLIHYLHTQLYFESPTKKPGLDKKHKLDSVAEKIISIKAQYASGNDMKYNVIWMVHCDFKDTKVTGIPVFSIYNQNKNLYVDLKLNVYKSFVEVLKCMRWPCGLVCAPKNGSYKYSSSDLELTYFTSNDNVELPMHLPYILRITNWICSVFEKCWKAVSGCIIQVFSHVWEFVGKSFKAIIFGLQFVAAKAQNLSPEQFIEIVKNTYMKTPDSYKPGMLKNLIENPNPIISSLVSKGPELCLMLIKWWKETEKIDVSSILKLLLDLRIFFLEPIMYALRPEIVVLAKIGFLMYQKLDDIFKTEPVSGICEPYFAKTYGEKYLPLMFTKKHQNNTAEINSCDGFYEIDSKDRVEAQCEIVMTKNSFDGFYVDDIDVDEIENKNRGKAKCGIDMAENSCDGFYEIDSKDRVEAQCEIVMTKNSFDGFYVDDIDVVEIENKNRGKAKCGIDMAENSCDGFNNDVAPLTEYEKKMIERPETVFTYDNMSDLKKVGIIVDYIDAVIKEDTLKRKCKENFRKDFKFILDFEEYKLVLLPSSLVRIQKVLLELVGKHSSLVPKGENATVVLNIFNKEIAFIASITENLSFGLFKKNTLLHNITS